MDLTVCIHTRGRHFNKALSFHHAPRRANKCGGLFLPVQAWQTIMARMGKEASLSSDQLEKERGRCRPRSARAGAPEGFSCPGLCLRVTRDRAASVRESALSASPTSTRFPQKAASLHCLQTRQGETRVLVQTEEVFKVIYCKPPATHPWRRQGEAACERASMEVVHE